jgi:hypothetical protein
LSLVKAIHHFTARGLPDLLAVASWSSSSAATALKYTKLTPRGNIGVVYMMIADIIENQQIPFARPHSFLVPNPLPTEHANRDQLEPSDCVSLLSPQLDKFGSIAIFLIMTVHNHFTSITGIKVAQQNYILIGLIAVVNMRQCHKILPCGNGTIINRKVGTIGPIHQVPA